MHGSGLFTWGQTQALSVCTLAPLGEHQIIDGLDIPRIANVSSIIITSHNSLLVQQDARAHQVVVKSVAVSQVNVL